MNDYDSPTRYCGRQKLVAGTTYLILVSIMFFLFCALFSANKQIGELETEIGMLNAQIGCMADMLQS